MPSFNYKVRDTKGELITGIIQGASEEAVAAELFSKGYIPVEIRQERAPKGISLLDIFSTVSPEDLIVFSRQLATLIKAGVPFLRSLQTLEEQTESKKLKNIIREILIEVEKGESFSSALSKFPKVFSQLYVSMIRVGEEAGVLDDMLDRLASLLEHEAATKARIKAALRYPIIVLVSLTAAFFFLTAFVVPRFAGLYGAARVQLPFPTRALIFMNKALREYYMLIGGGIAGVFLLFKLYIRTPSGRWNWDRLKLKLPIMGPIIEKSMMSRFARIFATLYRSGVPMLHSLDVVSGTLENVLIARAVNVIKEAVREGKGLAEPMGKTGVFPPIVVQMVAVGEETGALDEMLTKISEYYDLEVEYAIRNLSTTLEPVLLVALAGAILFLALGIFLPIWDMISALKR
jgi:type II secretory pathway component PulF